MAAVVLISSLVFCSVSHADRRNFVWAYEAKTIGKGEAETEYYFTALANKAPTDTDYQMDFHHDLELEYGITDHFDLALYQMFRHQEGEDFQYRGYKVRARYRFGEAEEYFLDTLLYVELIHKPLSNEIEFEEKGVFSKNIGSFLISFNTTLEQEAQYEAALQEYQFTQTLALGYQIKPWLTVGTEWMVNTLITSNAGYENTACLAGPTISFAGQKVWWNLGALYQLTQEYDEHARFEVRSLLGIYL